MEMLSELVSSSSSSVKITVILAEIKGLLSLLLNLNQVVWKELFREGLEWSEGVEDGEGMDDKFHSPSTSSTRAGQHDSQGTR